MRKVFIVMAVVCSITLHAAPARDGKRFYKQPDGTVFSGVSKGDAFFHWIETSDGEIVMYDAPKKQYEKAQIGPDALKGSGRIYHPSKRRSKSDTSETLSQKRKALHTLWIKKRIEIKKQQSEKNAVKR